MPTAIGGTFFFLPVLPSDLQLADADVDIIAYSPSTVRSYRGNCYLTATLCGAFAELYWLCPNSCANSQAFRLAHRDVDSAALDSVARGVRGETSTPKYSSRVHR